MRNLIKNNDGSKVRGETSAERVANTTRYALGLTPFVLSMILLGCGSSGNNAEQQPVEVPDPDPQTPTTQIEDITCDSNYFLEPLSATLADSDVLISTLIDGNKTSQSSWQAISVDSELIIELNDPALVKSLVVSWQDTSISHGYSVSASKDKDEWITLVNQSQSEEQATIPAVVDLTQSTEATAKYLKLSLSGSALSEASAVLEVEAFGCRQDVAHDIELIDWYLSVPTDTDNNGRSDSISEQSLAGGYQDMRFFRTSEDGGLTFATSVSGYKTSTNTSYVRSELREMLRRGNSEHKTQGVNANNWVFSSAPDSDLAAAGGVDGSLTAELAVNQVTSTGESYQIGRVIIGQIHANDDEPVRLYYRKLPNNENGAIYIAHELLGGDDTYYELIGSRSSNASNPADGIPLNEKFSYQINVTGNFLEVTITKADGSRYVQQVDMSASGYDEGGQYMYFKAGVYNQNNSGDQHDYVQVTFYQITNSHQGYDY